MNETSPETQVLGFLWRRRRRMPMPLEALVTNARAMLSDRDGDFVEVLESLRDEGVVLETGEGWSLPRSAHDRARAAMREAVSVGYSRGAARLVGSDAHRRYVRAVYGWDVPSLNMMGPTQRQMLKARCALRPAHRFLDLGCNTGGITSWLAVESGAVGVGVDLAASAIEMARGLPGRLSFDVQDMDELELPAEAFDVVVAVDTLYFPDNLAATLLAVFASLKPGGRLVASYSCYRNDRGSDDELTLSGSGFGRALPDGVQAEWEEVTELGREAWGRKLAALAELKAAFAAEGLHDLWLSRQRESETLAGVYDRGWARRYLVTAVKPG